MGRRFVGHLSADSVRIVAARPVHSRAGARGLPARIGQQIALELDGPTPTWVARLDNQDLQHQLGPGTWARGAAYARDGAVLKVTSSDEGHTLHAIVAGSSRSHYAVEVTAGAERAVLAAAWSGWCSCPVSYDCKHVAAVLLAVRARLVAQPQVAGPDWESRLADLVAPLATLPQASRLGLLLELQPPSDRYGTGPRLRLRPMIMGKSGTWIKTGASWRDVESAYRTVPLVPEQRAAVLAVMLRYRSQQPYISAYSDPSIHLDDLGPGVWILLRDVLRSGVSLLPDGHSELRSNVRAARVELVAQPATLTLDLRRPDPSGDAELAVRIRIPGHDEPALDQVTLLGDPAHGILLAGTDPVLLVPFDAPLDEATTRLVRQGESVRIPAQDVASFLARYYPVLRKRVTVESSDGSVEFPQVRPPRLVLRVDFEANHRTRLRWGFEYPVLDELVCVPIGGARSGAPRDIEAEQALLDSVGDLDLLPGLRIESDGAPRLVPDQVITGRQTVEFVERVLPRLDSRDDITVERHGTPVEYAETTEPPVLSFSAGDAPPEAGPDWFDLGVTVTIAGEDVPFQPLFIALVHREDHLVLDSGTWFRLDRPELETLRRLIDEASELGDPENPGLRISRWQAGLWEELVSLGVVAQQSKRWAESVGALLGLTEMPTPPAPAGLRAELRPYQLQGYQWLSLLWDHHLGGILADDMGLGKTMQALTMAARAQEQGGLTEPLLIVAPTSVVGTWAGEAARFTPGLTVVTVTETERRSGRKIVELVAGAHLVVTSYALLRIDEDAYRAVSWSGLILDEAQFVKNHQAKTYQVARRLTAPMKLAITGTPLENSLMDLWSLLSITAPGLFPNPQRFTESYRKPIESGREPEQLARLRQRIRPLMLRRTKEQVAPELPPKIEQVLEVTLDPAHQRIYDKYLQRERTRVLGLVEDLQRNRIAIFRSLTLLRQLSLDASLVDDKYAGKIPSAKIDMLVDQVVELAAEGHRALVFSQFTGFLRLVRERLTAAGVAYSYLDGRTRDRPGKIAEFTDSDIPVFLISLKAGGFGLTLTQADYVFVLDPWWNPAAEAQAVDRTHRIGQDKTVFVYRLVAVGTIEEKVVALQERKRQLFARVVDEGALLGSVLSAEDIRGLFDR